jgi:hypothetical protein
MFGKMSTKQDIDFKLLERAMGVKQSGRGGGKNKRKWNINGQNQHEQMKASNGSIELEVLDCTVGISGSSKIPNVNNTPYKPDQFPSSEEICEHKRIALKFCFEPKLCKSCCLVIHGTLLNQIIPHPSLNAILSRMIEQL